ncbi:hypothetical protein HBI13_109560 [Parastagonospora nodorum]|nr:hypothetical protein HBI10_141260 [Parastagonospora nodorum]KAH4020979.1 hypothetical protein HBI13_109560 [Parastagonospora nodorum]KAH4899026.1 hypothetical protein HBH74_187320 [Parastagonospora nodorum]KAH4947358.1 hypothetical protein HBH73_135290 [Parastagonospora nodorum]KAH5090287.1 hypothetical protein HBH72_218430 [Parastagonospora nodorum]
MTESFRWQSHNHKLDEKTLHTWHDLSDNRQGSQRAHIIAPVPTPPPAPSREQLRKRLTEKRAKKCRDR